jgi:hypothetical protein
MKSIQIISQDLFDKVRSRFSNLEMGDETGAVTIDPAEARFFDFDFVKENINLGRVSISLNELGSLKVYYSQGITENQNDPAKQLWYSFLKEMRFFAMRRLLRFDTRDIAKTNLDKNDFQYLANKEPKEEQDMTTMNESRWNNKSSRKTSRAIKGKTEVIVRHANPVDEEYAGSRSQKKNIKAIFIQNHDGERFKYPFIHPAGAFAMAQHVDHGGAPHDPAGKAIIKMSEDIAQLQEFQRKIQRASLHDDATGITERAVGRLQELKSKIDALGKRHHYESWVMEFNEQEHMDDGIMELDAVTMEEYKQKFTQTNFQEELASYFLLLHRIMSEDNTVDLEEYVSEQDIEEATALQSLGGNPRFAQNRPMPQHSAAPWDDEDEENNNKPTNTKGSDGAEHGGHSRARHLARQAIPKEKTAAESIDAFEEWADATEQGNLTADQIRELQNAIKELPDGKLQLGTNGQTAIEFFADIVELHPELAEKFQKQFGINPDADPIKDVLIPWAEEEENYPNLITLLGLGNTEKPQAEQPPQQPAAPAPEQPTAENDDMSMNKGTMETANPRAMIKMIAEKVKSFYNRDNPEVGPFRGNEGIAIDVEKECSDQFGPQAGQQARLMAEALMKKLTNEWEERHGKSAAVGAVDPDDGLARLKELLGNVKSKVEGIGDQGVSTRDFNKNIMPAEGSKQDFRTHGMDSKPSKENPAGNPPPLDWKVDPIQAATDRAHDAGAKLLQRLAGIRKK